jgi:hypothetical protein
MATALAAYLYAEPLHGEDVVVPNPTEARSDA